ncbi:MAG: TetR/AcrR family transcriptional regulator [Planctomycetes bacterium]|nr:TetR/AcrR family transcriptional regulator [Planctomycetota bacterium]
MAQAERGEKTRDEMIQAAIRLFALHGYHGTSMNDILEAVSLSKGAFYHHFSSKEALGLDVLEQVRRDYEQEVFGAIRVEGKPEARWRSMLGKMVELNESGLWENCLLLGRLVQEANQQEGELFERVKEVVSQIIEFWVELIEDAQSGGTLRGDLDRRVLAELMVATFLGAIGCGELNGEALQLRHIAAQLEKLLEVNI